MLHNKLSGATFKFDISSLSRTEYTKKTCNDKANV